MNNRKMYNTTLDADLIREIKILAARLDKRQNDILEEAIQDLLKKYQDKNEKAPVGPTRTLTTGHPNSSEKEYPNTPQTNHPNS